MHVAHFSICEQKENKKCQEKIEYEINPFCYWFQCKCKIRNKPQRGALIKLNLLWDNFDFPVLSHTIRD